MIIIIIFVNLAVDCGTLPLPTNGSLQGSLTVFPSIVEFACDRGFILEGSSIRRCQANASWSGESTHCRGRFCLPLSIAMLQNTLSHPVFMFQCTWDTTAGFPFRPKKTYDKIIEALLDVSLDVEILRKEKVHSKGNSKLI